MLMEIAFDEPFIQEITHVIPEPDCTDHTYLNNALPMYKSMYRWVTLCLIVVY